MPRGKWSLSIPILRRRLPAFFAVAALTVCFLSPALAAGNLQVRDAWIALAPPVMKVHGGYFTLLNTGGTERHLVAVESPAYGSAMLHVSREMNGVATMEHVDRLTVAPGKPVRFAPGGLHVMLMGPLGKQVEGAAVPLTLVFEDGERIEATATIRRSTPGDSHADHSGHGMHPHKGM